MCIFVCVCCKSQIVIYLSVNILNYASKYCNVLRLYYNLTKE
jgi:hypothetical protein